jgi:hypothetical protein
MSFGGRGGFNSGGGRGGGGFGKGGGQRGGGGGFGGKGGKGGGGSHNNSRGRGGSGGGSRGMGRGTPRNLAHLQPPQRMGKLTGHTDTVTSLDVCDERKQLFSASTDGSIKVWSWENGNFT